MLTGQGTDAPCALRATSIQRFDDQPATQVRQVMSDSGHGYRSSAWMRPYDQFGIEHIGTRYSVRYRAHTHLTAERSITTMRE